MWEMHKCTDPVMGGTIYSTRNGQRVCVATERRSIERMNQITEVGTVWGLQPWSGESLSSKENR